MKQLSFVMGFIWLFASVASLVFGSFFLDRKKLKKELFDYWNLNTESSTKIFLRRTGLLIAWSGFLTPVIYPFVGLIMTAIFILLT